MDIHGSIATNLSSAVQNARRLSGHPVTRSLSHWTDLLHHARRELAAGSSEVLQSLILELETELADRTV